MPSRFEPSEAFPRRLKKKIRTEVSKKKTANNREPLETILRKKLVAAGGVGSKTFLGCGKRRSQDPVPRAEQGPREDCQGNDAIIQQYPPRHFSVTARCT